MNVAHPSHQSHQGHNSHPAIANVPNPTPIPVIQQVPVIPPLQLGSTGKKSCSDLSIYSDLSKAAISLSVISIFVVIAVLLLNYFKFNNIPIIGSASSYHSFLYVFMIIVTGLFCTFMFKYNERCSCKVDIFTDASFNDGMKAAIIFNMIALIILMLVLLNRLFTPFSIKGQQFGRRFFPTLPSLPSLPTSSSLFSSTSSSSSSSPPSTAYYN